MAVEQKHLVLEFQNGGTPEFPPRAKHLVLEFEPKYYLPPSPVPSKPKFQRARHIPGTVTANRMDVHTGNSANALSAEVSFDEIVREIDIQAFINDLDIVFIAPDGTQCDEGIVVKGGFRNFTGEYRGFKHRNTTPGQVAEYEVIGTYRHWPDLTWAARMVVSYMAINAHDTFTDAAVLELLSRLQPGGYLHNTFGPPGTDEVDCGFLKLFTFNGDMAARTMAKTGVVFRWDIDGTVHNQNNWPVHVRNPLLPNVVTVSTTDGWTGLTSFDMKNNNIDGVLPYFGDCLALRYFYSNRNPSMVGSIPSFAGCTALFVFSIYAAWPGGQYTGDIPSFVGCSNLSNFNIVWNDFSGETPAFNAACPLVYLYISGNSFTTHAPNIAQVSRIHLDARYNSLNQQAIDNYLLDYEAIKTAMALSGKSYSILLNSNASGPSVVGLAAKQAIIDEFAATPGSGALMITHD